MNTSKWQVRVMRDVSEFGIVNIEADSAELAIEKAIEIFSDDIERKLVTDEIAGVVSVTMVERIEGDK